MSFFEDLGDAFESNMGWFMLANAVNTNRIASAQQSIASGQREMAEADQEMKRRELALLEKQIALSEQMQKEQRQALAEQERLQRLAEERQATEAYHLRQFRGLLAYCEVIIANGEESEFNLATLEVLMPSLEAFKDICSLNSEDFARMQKFYVHFKSARSKCLSNHKSNACIAVAIEHLDFWTAKTKALSNVETKFSTAISRWTESLFTRVQNPKLLQVALSLSESPLRKFFPREQDTKAVRASITDREGLIQCSQEEWQKIYDQCVEWNKNVSDEAKTLRLESSQLIDTWFIENTWLHSLKTKSAGIDKANARNEISKKSMGGIQAGLMKTGPTALATGFDSATACPTSPETSAYGTRKTAFSSAHIQALSATNHYQSIAVDSSVQPFLVVLDQAAKHAATKSDAPELTGLLLVPSPAIQSYRRFVSQLNDTDHTLISIQNALVTLQCIAKSELPNCLEEGVSRILYINRETVASKQRELLEIRNKRLAEFQARSGKAPRPQTHQNSPKTKSKPVNNSPHFSESVCEASRLLAWIKAGNISEARENLASQVDPESVEYKEVQQALEHVLSKWNQLRQSYDKVNTAYKNTVSAKGQQDHLQHGSHSDLDVAIHAFHKLLMSASFHPGSELQVILEEWIEDLQPICEFTGMCLSWDTVEMPLEELIKHVRPRDVTPSDAYINALCAIAASDGVFCTQEKWAAKKWVIEARLPIDTAIITGTIEQWCQFARERSLQRSVAQSIVDTTILRKNPLAAKLLQGLSAVLRADGKTTAAETKVFELMKRQLS